MKDTTILNSSFALAGFTSGREGIWSRNEPLDPPTSDYTLLSNKLGLPLHKFIRPYQAGGEKAAIVSSEHGGSGVIKDNDLKKTDGLITAEKGLVLSIIAADCAPVFMFSEKAGIIGLLHCGWRSAAGLLISSGIECMKSLGADPSEIQVIIGPHICTDCYETGEDVYAAYSNSFAGNELDRIFRHRSSRLHLDLAQAIRFKATAEGISKTNISAVGDCTCHDTAFYSYRRGDRGRQNLAYIVLK